MSLENPNLKETLRKSTVSNAVFKNTDFSKSCSYKIEGAFTYYVITEDGRDGRSLKYLLMIIGEGDWPYDDISKITFFTKRNSFEIKNSK